MEDVIRYNKQSVREMIFLQCSANTQLNENDEKSRKIANKFELKKIDEKIVDLERTLVYTQLSRVAAMIRTVWSKLVHAPNPR